MRASCSSRVRFEVRITAGRERAVTVPISGIVIWKSDSISSRKASNSSSARSISSISSTTGSVLKYGEDQEVIRAAGLEQLVQQR